MFSENELEEVAFLWLFPYGVNGLKTNRKPIISVLQYFQNRLLGKQNRFRKNAMYIFWAPEKVGMSNNNNNVMLLRDA